MLYPHAVTVALPRREARAGIGMVPGEEEPVSLRAAITPMRHSAAMDRFGIEVTAPYEMFAPVSGEVFLRVNGVVRWNEDEYVIRAVMPWRAFSSPSGIHCLLEKRN